MNLRQLEFSAQELSDIGWETLFYEPGEPLYSGTPWCGLEPGMARSVVPMYLLYDDPSQCAREAWLKVIPEMIDKYDSLEKQLLAGAEFAKEERAYLERMLAGIREKGGGNER